MRRALCSLLLLAALGGLGCEGSQSIAPELRAAVASAEASAETARKLELFEAQLEEATRRVEHLDIAPIPEHQRLELEALFRRLEREELEKGAAGLVGHRRHPLAPAIASLPTPCATAFDSMSEGRSGLEPPAEDRRDPSGSS